MLSILSCKCESSRKFPYIVHTSDSHEYSYSHSYTCSPTLVHNTTLSDAVFLLDPVLS